VEWWGAILLLILELYSLSVTCGSWWNKFSSSYRPTSVDCSSNERNCDIVEVNEGNGMEFFNQFPK